MKRTAVTNSDHSVISVIITNDDSMRIEPIAGQLMIPLTAEYAEQITNAGDDIMYVRHDARGKVTMSKVVREKKPLVAKEKKNTVL